MYDVNFALRLLLASVSFAGYSMFLTKKWGIHTLIAPAVVIPGLGVTMVFAGILNVMPPMVYALCIGGAALFVYTLIVNKGASGLLHPAHLTLVAALGWMLWRLQGTQVYSIDNFHHWMKVLNVLLTNNELPSWRTPVITFQAYPTGSASYLYYMLKLVGSREDLAVIFQLMMIAVFCLPFFALPKKGKWLGWVVLAGFLAVTLARLYERDTMLVDDLQAFIGLAAIAMAYYYRDDLNKALICLMPVSIYTVLIKNSAFFFIIMTALFMLVALRDKRRLGRLKVVFFVLVLPSLAFYLWTAHVKLMFHGGLGFGMESKHALNISSYVNQAQSWGLNRVPELTQRVFEQAFGTQYFPGTLALVSTLAAVVLTIPLWVAGRVREGIRSLLLLAFAWLGYVLWEVGIVGMFAVSMPWGETDMLACAERYMMTGLVYMFGLMVVSAVESVNAWPPIKPTAAGAAAVLLAAACAIVPVRYSGFPGEWGAPIRKKAARTYFAELKQKHPYYYGDKGMFVTDQTNQYYMLNKYMQTDFLIENLLPLSIADAADPMDVAMDAVYYASDYDFLLVDTKNQDVLDALMDAYEKGTFYHMKVYFGLNFMPQ